MTPSPTLTDLSNMPDAEFLRCVAERPFPRDWDTRAAAAYAANRLMNLQGLVLSEILNLTTKTNQHEKAD